MPPSRIKDIAALWSYGYNRERLALKVSGLPKKRPTDENIRTQLDSLIVKTR